ncbi:response regulator transcription factor [Streptomyces sp. ZAF1911]|uniref:LuxR C-terminal-related transcriptional regulator n=1 Tax=Streptomyces sp. ZAF1911 TaxID=2944129 RepID=UPI00237ABC1A|nr:response regulator transcription factor [Streptomyces sp. ZAF1911]MDD9376898.1 response regulator transcription factor [Streptomyces sp. ZAF1911]
MISVLVVNDQSLPRRALRMLLAAEPELTVVGEAASGAEAVRLSASLGPDVALMDSRLLKEDGIVAIRFIAQLAPRVLVLTAPGHERYACPALRAGASGLLLTDAAPDELIAAIQVVAIGDAVITPTLTRALIDVVREQGSIRPFTPKSGLEALTRRERDVLVAVASGLTNAEIADRLSISRTTVKTHVSHILAKSGSRGRVQAVSFAYESGLIRPAA